jgi:SAM-dependent methyltransferase
MKETTMTNSASYWNTRFANNWESCGGPSQSKFFARLALDHLPHWLLMVIRRQSLTLVDWGCAQGDGTDVWASYIDTEQLTGVDFSSIAIEQATQRYPAIRFINEDWLAGESGNPQVFDVVFSSNTLEHFHKPYDILCTLCHRAKKSIVLVLPYQEMDRIDEHFFSFLPENLPLVLPNGFRLAWSRVVDVHQLAGTLWGGDQIILVYAEPRWLDNLELTLSDCRIEQSDRSTQIKQLNASLAERDGQIANLTQTIAERDGQIANLTQAIAKRDGQIANLTQAIAKRDGQIANLTQAIAERDGQITRLLSSKSWQLTKPLRFLGRLLRGESPVETIIKWRP